MSQAFGLRPGSGKPRTAYCARVVVQERTFLLKFAFFSGLEQEGILEGEDVFSRICALEPTGETSLTLWTSLKVLVSETQCMKEQRRRCVLRLTSMWPKGGSTAGAQRPLGMALSLSLLFLSAFADWLLYMAASPLFTHAFLHSFFVLANLCGETAVWQDCSRRQDTKMSRSPLAPQWWQEWEEERGEEQKGALHSGQSGEGAVQWTPPGF